MSFRIDGRFGMFGTLHTRPRSAARVVTTADQLRAQERHDRLRAALGASVQLRGALVDLQKSLAAGRGARAARVSSTSDPRLDLVGQVSRMASTEEVNTTPTSYGPLDPLFEGDSTSVPTVGGVYDGDQGTTTLTFEITQTRNVGGNRHIWVRMLDDQGDRIQSRRLRAGPPADTAVTFRNGLTVSLSAGTVERNDSFDIAVSVDTPSAVDADRPLGGTRADNPSLEAGQRVVAGSFEVDGELIAVDPSDTLNDVLARITASNAGVDATFDQASETVHLARRDPSADAIVLANDSSGFLAAVKLAGAVATPGQLPDDERVLSDVAAFSAVRSGTIQINGADVSIDVSTDTLNDVMRRIEAAAPGVSTSVSSQRVTIVGRPGSDLTLADGGTRFFDALSLRTGTHRGAPGSGPDPAKVVEAAREAFAHLDELLTASRPAEGDTPGPLSRLRSSIEEAIRDAAGGAESAILRTRIGVDFDFRDAARDVVSLRGHGNVLRRAVARRQGAVFAFFGTERPQGEGLISVLTELLGDEQAALRSAVGSSGVLVRTSA